MTPHEAIIYDAILQRATGLYKAAVHHRGPLKLPKELLCLLQAIIEAPTLGGSEEGLPPPVVVPDLPLEEKPSAWEKERLVEDRYGRRPLTCDPPAPGPV